VIMQVIQQMQQQQHGGEGTGVYNETTVTDAFAYDKLAVDQTSSSVEGWGEFIEITLTTRPDADTSSTATFLELEFDGNYNDPCNFGLLGTSDALAKSDFYLI
jgi:hypothetical protein